MADSPISFVERANNLAREAATLSGKDSDAIIAWWNKERRENEDIPPALFQEPLHHLAKALAASGDVESIVRIEEKLDAAIAAFETNREPDEVLELIAKAATPKKVPSRPRPVEWQMVTADVIAPAGKHSAYQWVEANTNAVAELVRVDGRLHDASDRRLLEYTRSAVFFVVAAKSLAGLERPLWEAMRAKLPDNQIPSRNDIANAVHMRPMSLWTVVRLHSALRHLADKDDRFNLRGLGLAGLPRSCVAPSVWSLKLETINRYCEANGIKRRVLENIISSKMPGTHKFKIFDQPIETGKKVEYGFTTEAAEIIMESVKEVSGPGKYTLDFNDVFFTPPPHEIAALPIDKGNAVTTLATGFISG